jgi:hypothetical protein
VQVLLNIEKFPTQIDIAIVTDQPAALRTVLTAYHLQHNVRAVGPATKSYESDKNNYRLVWEHRHYMQQAFYLGIVR